MDINNLDESQYVDLFATEPKTPEEKLATAIGANFKAEEQEVNLFEQEPKLEDSTTETTSIVEEVPKDGDEVEEKEEVNLFEEKEPAEDKKEKSLDFAKYFQDRYKEGKLTPITESLEDGTEKEFIPQSFDEIDEVIELQVQHKLAEAMKKQGEDWYANKSPAWKAVAKYAELTDDPAEIVPFIQGIRTIDSVSSIDENEIEGAEQIIRIRLEQRGENDDVIEEQIEALKTTNKLVSTAQKYKPTILQEEQRQLVQMQRQREQEEREYVQTISEIREQAIKAIETPLFGKQKLKAEEKAIIYDLIAAPSDETQGYPIFSAIDNLYEKRDFETLREIALLLGKKDSYHSYVSNADVSKSAANLQKKLRVATDSVKSGTKDQYEDPEKVTIPRVQYNKTPRFGR